MPLRDAYPLNFLRGLARRFGIEAKAIVPAEHAVLSAVYILDGAHVLRGKPSTPKVIDTFREQTSLIRAASALTSLRLPLPIETHEGHPYIVEEGVLWTMYARIPGHILDSWEQVASAADAETKTVCAAMRSMHDATKGKLHTFFDERLPFLTEMQNGLNALGHLLSPHAQQRLALAFTRVEQHIRSVQQGELCFVHGDFHHGNLLVDDAGETVGIIDCDWCRIGHPYEDLAYLAMMCLRSYDTEAFMFPEDEYRQILEWYGVHQDAQSLFSEYLLIAGLFDVLLFHKMESMENRDYYLHYQISLVHALTAKFTAHDLPKPVHAPSFHFPVELSEKYLTIARELKISAADIEEHFVRGSGHGGQKINKTSSCVELHYAPLNVNVRVQDQREQSRNRIAAYKLLLEKIEEKVKGDDSARGQEQHRIAKQKQRRSRKAKAKILQDKRKRGEVKERRKDVAD
ncbi:MAG: phosphotransferase [Candidatus Peregrinibacteria bacterium]|nr:phosphotransferase [Candidatus Peregrinibacteria bacterium]